MLVPSVLKEPWIKAKHKRHRLNSYFIKFTPSPADRLYKDFGLFLRASIPQEAQNMKLDLQLARGRSVLSEIVPYGTFEFTSNEVIESLRYMHLVKHQIFSF